MDHRKFLHLYESNELALEVKPTRAIIMALTRQVDGPNYPLFLFFSFLWIAALVAMAPLYLWLSPWAAAFAAFLVVMLPRPMRRTAIQGVRHKALHDPEFFQAALDDGLVKVLPYP